MPHHTTLPLNKSVHACRPYKYGHVIEVKVNPDGTPSVTKWYTLGRNSKETAYVMPDNKTVYITDDGTNVGFFKFIATKAGDLSQGAGTHGGHME